MCVCGVQMLVERDAQLESLQQEYRAIGEGNIHGRGSVGQVCGTNTHTYSCIMRVCVYVCVIGEGNMHGAVGQLRCVCMCLCLCQCLCVCVFIRFS